ncbi:MAG: DUF456 domain-containing protein [Candidatus Methylacidiphilales bacterium]
MPDWFLLALVVVLMVLGLVGSVVPGLPGTPIILGAALLHKWLAPVSVPWWVIIVMAAIAALGQILEMCAGVLGAKWFGASRWGIIGAGVGLLGGLFFSIPGLIFGPLIGAILGELTLGHREPHDAARAGLGAGLGFAAGMVLKIFVALVLLAIFWFSLGAVVLRATN